MDHGGQFEGEGRIISQDQVGGVDFCDNPPMAEAFTAQTQNLNETNTLTQSQSLSLVQKDDGGGHGPIPQASLSSDGTAAQKEWENLGYTGGGREEDEEEDIDEVMKEEEEEMSEGSSSLIRCQSPDTLMTDSSYSETASLLETPFSPGTSPEPTSPVCAMLGQETAYPISQVALSQSDVQVESRTLKTESVASNTECITLGPTLTMWPVDSTPMVSDTRPPCPRGSICITEAKESIAKDENSATEHLTSSMEPISSHGPTCAVGVSSSYTGSISSNAKTFSVPSCLTALNISVDSTAMKATAASLDITTAPMATSIESTSTTGPITSYWEQMTSTPGPTGFSLSTCATGSITNNAPLDALEQLAQRGDDDHLPQYLHQIAEAFVRQEDYQRALWCIQLERLYHQRVLDNLSALQEQWETRCRRTSTDVAAKHLDTLRHICQSHNRPRAKDAVCVSLDVLRPTIVEGGALPPCLSARQVIEGMQPRAEVSSHSQSCHPVVPSISSAVELNSPVISETDRGDLHRGLGERDSVDGSQLTDGHGSDREEGKAEGGVEYTNSVIRNELHPSKAGEMDRSKPAELQGGALGLVQEKEAKREEEERDEEEVEAVAMEDEEEEEERLKEGDSRFYQKAPPVETPGSGAELEVQQLHQEAPAEEKLHGETQESAKTCPHQEAHLPPEAHMKKQEWVEEEQEEEQEVEYEVEQADIIREAASLDEMAKLITVEEMSPASGLVSILKKRSVCVEELGVFGGSEPRPYKPRSKRRVRFSTPNDGYDHDIGSVDSCLLLFLLCLVTVVISVGGTALYCSLGGAHSSVCQDFSRNADFYFGQIHRGISHIQHWFNPGS